VKLPELVDGVDGANVKLPALVDGVDGEDEKFLHWLATGGRIGGL